MPFSLSDTYVPSLWVEGVREKALKKPSIINSGVLVNTPELNEKASGSGTDVTIPFFRDLTDQDEAIQVEGTAPTAQGMGVGQQKAAILNRVISNNITAMAKNVGFKDPLGDLYGMVADRQLMLKQKRLFAILRGAFGVSAISIALSEDHFHEAIANQVAGDILDGKMFIDAIARLGENMDALRNGAILAHSTIRAGMLKQDEKEFTRSIENGVFIERYKGIPLYISDSLVRAGTTDGNVFETFVMAKGVIGYGEKEQVFNEDGGKKKIDLASLSYIADTKTNVEEVIDRTRSIMHLNGLKWTGTPAGQSATNGELATGSNWAMAAADAKLIGAVRIRTNG